MSTEKIDLDKIRLDGGTQARAALNEEAVAEYAEAMSTDVLPPVVVYHDGSAYWLADGFHRVAALRRLKHLRVECVVRQGTNRDAILYSVGANADHGLRRTNSDKRRSVELLLSDEEWKQKSDRWIADACRVSNTLVGAMRAQLSTDDSCKPRTGKDGKTRRTSERFCGRGADRERAIAERQAARAVGCPVADVRRAGRIRDAAPDLIDRLIDGTIPTLEEAERMVAERMVPTPSGPPTPLTAAELDELMRQLRSLSDVCWNYSQTLSLGYEESVRSERFESLKRDSWDRVVAVIGLVRRLTGINAHARVVTPKELAEDGARERLVDAYQPPPTVLT